MLCVHVSTIGTTTLCKESKTLPILEEYNILLSTSAYVIIPRDIWMSMKFKMVVIIQNGRYLQIYVETLLLPMYRGCYLKFRCYLR